MRLQSLTIENFKSIPSTSLHSFHPLDIFIGKNNSGKSNILDAAMLFLHESFPSNNVFHMENSRVEAVISLEHGDCKSCGLHNTYTSIRCLFEKGKKTFSVGDKVFPNNRAVEFLLRHAVHINTSRLLIEQRRDVDAQIQAGDISLFFANDVFTELMKSYPKAYQQLLAHLHNMFPEVTLSPDETFFPALFAVRGVNFDTPPSDASLLEIVAGLGSGYLQVFALLLFALHPRYSLIIIDEPENHLHIGLQKKLLRIFQEIDTRKHILLSTHSPLFIEAENFSGLHRVVKQSDRTLVYPQSAPNTQLDINRLAQELNLESNEMLFSDHVLLVEGEADEIFVKGLMEKFYSGDKEILVLAVHSNTNFKIYRDCLEYFSIPYSILTDHDSLRGHVDVIEEILQYKNNSQEKDIFSILKKNHIFVLPHGALEQHYPKKYQRREDSKPINARRAARNITVEEYQHSRLQTIRDFILSADSAFTSRSSLRL